MEYFNFDQAARDDDVASDCQELGDADSLFNDHSQPATAPASAVPPSAPVNNADAAPQEPPPQQEPAYPIHRAEEPCVFCRSMGLDCFVAQRGVMQQNGCTCCISLYRKCSFTHAPQQGKYINTLHIVGEDSCVNTGSLTGTKTLRSFSGPSNGPLVEEPEGRPRKSGARFSRDAIKVLKTWFSAHVAHPYPTDEEKADLKTKTGLKKTQISNWLANARRRSKNRAPVQDSDAIPIPGKSLPPGVDMSELNPLERWKHSPPEHEPAAPRDIIQAMATTSFDSEKANDGAQSGHIRSNSRRTGSSSNNEASLSNVRTTRSSSGYSLSASKSSASELSFASAFSHRSSRASFNSMEKKERRRHRHKSAVASNPFQKARGPRAFQCTFCTDSFGTKYDWQRHEKSLHLALDNWTCAPQGAIVIEGEKRFCVFCRHPDADEDHLDSHNYSACQEKTIQERTFYRKDHLNQHLRLMHNAKLGSWMDSWKSTLTEIKSRCGFCPKTFSTWKDRVDHLAAHFKAGSSMTQWQGDWGFEPHVHKMVENAMPPYLIGTDRNTLDPFTARKNGTAKGPGATASNAQSHSTTLVSHTGCFRRLERELSVCIRRMTAQGIVPTDETIQAEARKIIFQTDDPWNQTCADNPTWLAVLKRNAGLCDTPNATDLQLGDLDMQPPFAADGGLRQAPMHTTPPTSQPGRSSTRPSSGFHSTVPSMQGSLASSLAGSSDLPFGGIRGSSGTLQGSSKKDTSIAQLSSSAPVTTAVDPMTPMSYDAELLQLLNNDDFGDLSHAIDDMQLESLGDQPAGGAMDLDHAGFPAPPAKNPPGFESSPFTAPPLGGMTGQPVSASFDPAYHANFYSSGNFGGDNDFAFGGFQGQRQ